METKKITNLITVICEAVTLAMGVSVVVLSWIHAITIDIAVLLLGIGMTCAGMAMMGKQGTER